MCGMTGRHTLLRCQKRAETEQIIQHQAYSTPDNSTPTEDTADHERIDISSRGAER